MTNETNSPSAQRPTRGQLAFLLDLVKRGGHMGGEPTAPMPTVEACERRGWVEFADAPAGVRLLDAGRLRCATADPAAYAAACVRTHISESAPRGPVLDETIPDVVSVTEVATLWGVSRTAVQKAIDTGRLPARQAGTTWVVRRSTAEALRPAGSVGAEGGDTP